MKTIFVPCFFKDGIISLNSRNSKDLLKKLSEFKRIGLFSTLQHLNLLNKIRFFLEENNKKIVLRDDGFILGCTAGKKVKEIDEEVDAFLCIGSGKFHPLEIALNTNKPVFILNPYSDSISRISEKEKQKYLRKRKGALAKALQAETFGILISLKTGQFNFPQAKKIKRKLEKKGRKAFLFAGDEISPERLLGFKEIDVWINTACPRIVEDYFDKAVLNPEELEFISHKKNLF
jgi:2-(3-amino-3-carboxypropyl)histidine synthase